MTKNKGSTARRMAHHFLSTISSTRNIITAQNIAINTPGKIRMTDSKHHRQFTLDKVLLKIAIELNPFPYYYVKNLEIKLKTLKSANYN